MTSFQLVFILEGSAQYSTGSQVFQVARGEGVICKSGQIDRFFFDRNCNTRHTWCEIAQDNLESALHNQLGEVRTQVISASQRMGWLVEMGLSLPGGSTHNAMCRHLGHALFWEFVRLARLSGGVQEDIPQHPAILRATTFMESHFAEPLTSQDIAREARMTVQHLRVLFQQTLQQTPLQYLWRVRLDQARRLVTGTGLTLAEISDACGFANPYHFSRKFRERFGQAPAQSRKEAWNQSADSKKS